MKVSRHTFWATNSSGDVSGILMRPTDATCLYVFAHGAGAGMEHSFMEAAAGQLADRGIASFRYNFPYKEAGKKPPNRPLILIEAVRSAVTEASLLAPGLPLFAGGKSMGGRMASAAASSEPLPGVKGLVFFGFPFHPPGRDSAERGAHLADVELPMLFLQGTRDKLANLDLLTLLLDEVTPTPTLHIVDGADHGFHVLKRSGRTDGEALAEMCDVFRDWVGEI